MSNYRQKWNTAGTYSNKEDALSKARLLRSEDIGPNEKPKYVKVVKTGGKWRVDWIYNG